MYKYLLCIALASGVVGTSVASDEPAPIDQAQARQLIKAVRANNIECARTILTTDRRLANLISSSGMSLLIIAAMQGSVSMGELLVQFGANIYYKWGRMTAYDVAVDYGEDGFAQFIRLTPERLRAAQARWTELRSAWTGLVARAGADGL